MIIAAVLDEFTRSSLVGTYTIIDILPSEDYSFISSYEPDFLLVESAWFGYLGKWHSKIFNLSPEIINLVEYCKSNSIPTVFWSKEDPVHFHRFLDTASLFDVVFTTDITVLSLYKRLLGHTSVFVLPFAFQPSKYNPIETIERFPLASFAGSYYSRYKERSFDQSTIFEAVISVCGLDIFNRYNNSQDKNYLFPDKFNSFVRGSLSYDEINRSYKGYNYGLNVNTVKYSESMFSRRVFELLGSGTLVISNFSKGMLYLFGDLVISSDDPEIIRSKLLFLINDMHFRMKVALAGVRKTLLEHTYAHRLNKICEVLKINKPSFNNLPRICVITTISNKDESIRMYKSLCAQSVVNWCAIFVFSNSLLFEEVSSSLFDARVTCETNFDLLDKKIGDLTVDSEWIAGFNPKDYYGPNYLLDLLLGTLYSDSNVFTKSSFYSYVDSNLVYINKERYNHALSVSLRRSILSKDLLDNIVFVFFLNFLIVDSFLPSSLSEGAISLDCFSYCENGANFSESAISSLVDDTELDKGHSIDELYVKATSMLVDIPPWLGKSSLRLEKLAYAFDLDNELGSLYSKLDKFGWHLVSKIPDGSYASIWADNAFLLEDFGLHEELNFHIVEGPGLPIDFLVRFESERGTLVEDLMFETNKNQHWVSPVGATHVRFGFRVFSSGSTRVMRFVLDWL